MDKIERAVQLVIQRENFILQAPPSFTSDVATDDLTFPKDYAVAARMIAERLWRMAKAYSDQAAEWDRL